MNARLKTKSKLFIALAFVALISRPSFAQKPTDTAQGKKDPLLLLASLPKSHIMWHDVKEAWWDGGQYVTRPLKWNFNQWMIVGTVAGMTWVFGQTDDDVARGFFQRNRGVTGSDLANIGNFYGSGIPTVLVGTGLYAYGLEANSARTRIVGRHVLQAFAYGGLTTTTLKILLGRARPFASGSGGPFVNIHGLTLQNAWNSLPSGHTTVACALSASLAADINDNLVTTGLYLLAATTVFGRMYTDNHWFSDTFLGGVIGSLAGFWAARETEHYDIVTNEPKDESLVIEPYGTGIRLAWKF